MTPRTDREAAAPLTAEEEADLRGPSPRHVQYVVARLLATLDAERAVQNGLRALLDGLARRHEYQPGFGPCICAYHVQWRASESPDEHR
jgi:hypothetical protein